jgi:hypothetical protein
MFSRSDTLELLQISLCNPRRAQRFAGRNTQRSTLQTPQGLDATHSDELFPVKREYIGTNSGAQPASFGGPKLLAPRTSKPRAIFKFGIRTDLSSEV